MRTRIITSPGRMRRGAPESLVDHALARTRASASRRSARRSGAARITAGSWAAGSSSGMRQSSGSGALAGFDGRPDFDDALQVFWIASCGGGGSSPATRPRRAVSVPKVLSTAARMRWRRAEREIERHAGERLRRLAVRAARNSAASRRISPARRPGTRRSTASRRRPRNTVRPRGRALSPAKNSSVSASRMRHCSARSVLRLVDQQMVEPVVELVQHPGGARLGDQRRARARSDRRNRARRARPWPRRRLSGSPRRRRTGASLRSSVSAARRRSRSAIEAVLLALQIGFEAGKLVAQLLRRSGGPCSAARLAFAALGEEGVEQRLRPVSGDRRPASAA